MVCINLNTAQRRVVSLVQRELRHLHITA